MDVAETIRLLDAAIQEQGEARAARASEGGQSEVEPGAPTAKVCGPTLVDPIDSKAPHAQRVNICGLYAKQSRNPTLGSRREAKATATPLLVRV